MSGGGGPRLSAAAPARPQPPGQPPVQCVTRSVVRVAGCDDGTLRAGDGGRAERGAVRPGPRRTRAVRRPRLLGRGARRLGVSHRTPDPQRDHARLVQCSRGDRAGLAAGESLMLRRLRELATPMVVLDATVVLCVVLVTVWSLHPSLLFSSTLITGGDTGA